MDTCDSERETERESISSMTTWPSYSCVWRVTQEILSLVDKIGLALGPAAAQHPEFGPGVCDVRQHGSACEREREREIIRNDP
jgi:hypothetical protein